VVEDGYEFFAKRQLVTLFSAPNYCGEFDNAGSMMTVDETLMCSFQVSVRRLLKNTGIQTGARFIKHIAAYKSIRYILCVARSDRHISFALGTVAYCPVWSPSFRSYARTMSPLADFETGRQEEVSVWRSRVESAGDAAAQRAPDQQQEGQEVTRPRRELHCMFWRASCARRVSPCGTTGTGLAAHGDSLSSVLCAAPRVQVGLRARHRVGCVAQSLASFKPSTVFYSDWRFLHVLLTFHCAIAYLFCITIGFCNCALFDFRLRMSLPMEIKR
jgi:hypothetical protein